MVKGSKAVAMQIEHWLQKEIISALLGVDVLPFSKLKPQGVESNLFMYHLRRLMAQDMVVKIAGGYQLTPKAKAFVDRASLSSLLIRLQPKMLTILSVQRPDGKYAILEHLHQPYLHWLAYPSGKVHYGEDIHAAAVRELHEKTGLTNVDLSLRGNIFIRFFSSKDPKEVVNHVCGYVFSGTTTQVDATEYATKNFRSFWGDEQLLHGPKTFQGNKEIAELLRQKGLFMASFDFVSDY